MSPNDADGIANGVDPDQTAPLGAVWSGSALFAQAYLSKNLGSLRYFGYSFFKVSVCCRYFYKEIKSYLEGAKVISIFEETAKQGIFKLKDYISLHLYLSQPPVGDYRECLGM